VMRRLDALDPGEVETAFAVLERAGAAELAAEGLAGDAIESRRQIDMRYVGQSYELTIEVGDPFDASSAAGLEERFHAEHDRMYGFSAPGEPTECVGLRVTTEEELIEGLSFAAYRRVSTVIFVPAPYGGGIEMVTIDPSDLDAAQYQDAALKVREAQ